MIKELFHLTGKGCNGIMINKIRNFWFEFRRHSGIFIFYRSVKNGIKNLFKWIPVIWYDRDWDYAYLMFLISKKLGNMSEFHRKHGNSTESESVANDLEMASKLAEKVSSSDYEDEVYKNYPDLLKKMQQPLEWKKLDNGYYSLINKFTEEESATIRKLTREKEKCWERDKHLLFNLMKSDLHKWWD